MIVELSGWMPLVSVGVKRASLVDVARATQWHSVRIRTRVWVRSLVYERLPFFVIAVYPQYFIFDRSGDGKSETISCHVTVA